jgi:hypothetical protein
MEESKMILQITSTEWLMLKDAVSAPAYFKEHYTQQDKQALSDKLNKTFEEQAIARAEAIAEVIDA